MADEGADAELTHAHNMTANKACISENHSFHLILVLLPVMASTRSFGQLCSEARDKLGMCVIADSECIFFSIGILFSSTGVANTTSNGILRETDEKNDCAKGGARQWDVEGEVEAAAGADARHVDTCVPVSVATGDMHDPRSSIPSSSHAATF